MSLTRILPSMIDSTAASDGDALVYSSANARFEFGAVGSGVVLYNTATNYH